MQNKNPKVTEDEFNQLFLEVIDETLSALGESAKTAIYFHIEQKFSIKRQDIPSRIDAFDHALNTLFGVGSKPLELMLMQRLHAKVKNDCKPMKADDFTFSNYINTVKQEFVTKTKAETTFLPRNTLEQADNEKSSKASSFVDALNLLADPVLIVDQKGTFLFLNVAFEKAMGTAKENWLGKSFLVLPYLSEDSKALGFRNLQLRYKGIQVEPYELEVTNTAGELFHYELNAKNIEYAGQQANLVICRDVTRRKKMEKRLKQYTENLELLVEEKAGKIKESEQKLRAILDASPDALMVFDPEATVLDCNEATVKMFGYGDKSELIGKNGLDLASEKDQQRITEVAENLLMHGGASKNIEYEFITKNGAQFPGEFSLSVIPDDQGKPACFVAVTKDISERKKAHEELLSSEREYRKLAQQIELAQERITYERDKAQTYLDVADVLLLALDPEGNITLLNRKGCSILGCEIEPVLGKNWFDLFVPPEEKTVQLCAHKLRLKGKTSRPEHTENIVVCAGGERRIIGWRHTLVRTRWGEVIGTLSSGEDITEQKMVQEALKESEEKFRGIVENSSDVIMLTRSDASISYLSPAIFELTGYTPEELYVDESQIFHPDDVQKIGATLSRALQGERGSNFQYRVVTKAGETRWVSHSWSPIFEHGKVKLVVSIVRDITEQKRLVNDLQASEERFRAISNSASDAIILVNKEEEVVYWNPAAEKTFGYTEKEAVGKKLPKFIGVPNEYQSYTNIFEQFAQEKLSLKNFELYAWRRNGTDFRIELSLSSILLKEKNCILAVVRDISERKKMEDALKRERDMLENITQNIGAGLTIIDRNYRILWANKYLKRLAPKAENSLCYSVYNHLDNVCPDCGVKKVFEGAAYDAHEYCIRRPNGEAVWSEIIVTPIKDQQGNVTSALELTVDITEKKQLQEKLLEEKNKLEAVTENINAGLLIIDRNYNIIWLNKHGKQIYGDVEQKKCYSTIHHRNSICSNCGVKKVFEGAAIDTRVIELQTPKDVSYQEITVTPMKDKDGNVVAALELAVDITEKKRMQSDLARYSHKLEDLVEQRTQQLKQAQAKLVKSERLVAIGELAGMVGHDLRNPLTSIKGAVYYLKAKYADELDETAKDMLLTIDKSIVYSNKIINDLLEYSRDIHLDLSTANPRMLLKNALALVTVPAGVKIVDFTAETPSLKVDSAKMTRVFLNIIKNAFDAMPNGGVLNVKSKETPEGWEITFTDNGSGMTKETLSKLWTPLFTTKAKGMGFGLAICKRIVTAHGGNISVESEVEKGTQFTITLPIEPKTAPEDNWIYNPPLTMMTNTVKPRR
ncbi:MAG: PAS domain S-box protein [Candidatus Bathyarchaeia archaeon]|jgi:PAS domain S-box-containing protein